MGTHSGNFRQAGLLAVIGLLAGCENPAGPSPSYLLVDPAAAPLPAAPTNLTALPVSSTRIDLDWEDNTGRETAMEVHRSPSGAGSFALLATLGSNVQTYSDQAVTPGGLYCYQVRAVRTGANETTVSQFSNTACATAAVPAIVAFASVAAGGAHTCALDPGGAAYCWGRGESGQLGVPSPPSTCLTDAGLAPCSMVPVPVGGGLTFIQLAGGGAHTCALTAGGTAWCWGSNTRGQIGDNTTLSRDAPVPVATALTFVAIDAGAEHTCALTSVGAVYCWGGNRNGELGDGTTIDQLAPVPVGGNLTFQAVTAGGFLNGHTCGLEAGGAAWCWGNNVSGQLGIGASDMSPHPVPALVAGGLTFTALTAGLGSHTCGLTGAGVAWCWGLGNQGALGIRPKRSSAVPVAVSGKLTFTELVAGGFFGHTCGLVGGAGYCWGDNDRGQVGDGTTADRTVPTAVAGGLSFLDMDAGYAHSCGRVTTGTLYCWGASGAGQLGSNSNSDSTVPARVFGQP